jgi:hypothetical protein
MTAEASTLSVVGFVLFRIQEISHTLHVAVSEGVIETVRARALQESVWLTEEDVGIQVLHDLTENPDVAITSVNRMKLGLTFADAKAGDVLACWSAVNGAYVARALKGQLSVHRTEEDAQIERCAYEIRRVVDIDAGRWVAAKQARRAKA